jgi:hypothetical protein
MDADLPLESDPRPAGGKPHRERVRGHRRHHHGRRWWRPLALAAAALQAGLAAVYYAKAVPPAPPAAAPEPRLIGMWLSDPDATIGAMQQTRRVTDQEELELRRTKFKTIVTYTETTITIRAGDAETTEPYEVLSKEDDAVVIRHKLNEATMVDHIRFIGLNHYTVESQAPDNATGPKQTTQAEYFRRIR